MNRNKIFLQLAKMSKYANKKYQMKTSSIHSSFWNNERFVELACLLEPDAYQYASEEIRNSSTIPCFGANIKFASPQAKNDKKSVILSMSNEVDGEDSRLYPYISDSLKVEPEIINFLDHGIDFGYLKLIKINYFSDYKLKLCMTNMILVKIHLGG